MLTTSSGKRQLSRQDLKSWGINVVIFLGPVFIYMIDVLQDGGKVSRNAVYLILIGLVGNLIKKLISDNTLPTNPTI